MVDKATKHWTRNASDEHAVANGCWFDESRGHHVLEFIEDNIKLYEGDCAGQTPHIMQWQYELLMRLFGWVRKSEDWADRASVRRFRKASIWIPKKNGKTPTAAMVGLYLLCADGGVGQKVYSAAKDGKQAMRMHMHARQMVRRSDALIAECKINKSTGRIHHTPTDSFYDVLAGDNIDGQEGLNGSIVIDETHVVDEKLARVLEYMGATRSEPMQFEVSTAGKHVDGYGKKQQDYGRLVEAGEVRDDEFLFMCYEAPQDATDEICLSPETWEKANPGWGVTIRPSEMKSTCERAHSRSLDAWIQWKMYRLNIWSNSANPWLRMDDWRQCGHDFTLEDCKHMPCWLGMDLSKTRDTTAVVACFKDGERVRIAPKFYLPEEAALNEERVPYREWSRDGHIKLVPGRVLEYDVIERDILELIDKLNVVGIVYDPTYAHDLTTRIENATGIERWEFKQSMGMFAAPTADMERLVLAGDLWHNKNPVMNWQVQNCAVKTDQSGNKRPVKPDGGDYRKIDGVVATVMGVLKTLDTDAGSVYNDRGVIQI